MKSRIFVTFILKILIRSNYVKTNILMGGEKWGNPNRTKSYRSKAENQQTQRNKRWVGNQTQVSLLPWASSFVRDWHNIFKNVVLNTNESCPKICSWNLFSRLSAVAAVHRSGNRNLTLIYLFHIKSSFLSPRLGCEWYCEKNVFFQTKEPTCVASATQKQKHTATLIIVDLLFG